MKEEDEERSEQMNMNLPRQLPSQDDTSADQVCLGDDSWDSLGKRMNSREFLSKDLLIKDCNDSNNCKVI